MALTFEDEVTCATCGSVIPPDQYEMQDEEEHDLLAWLDRTERAREEFKRANELLNKPLCKDCHSVIDMETKTTK